MKIFILWICSILITSSLFAQRDNTLLESPNGDTAFGKLISFSNVLKQPKKLSESHLPTRTAQTRKFKLNYWSLAFTNAHSQKPFGSFSRLFYTDWHPGLEIETGFNWKTKPHHDWIQTFSLGYFYHQFIQHSISFYTEGGYSYKFPHTITALAKLGAGYMQAIPDSKVFVIDGKNGYAKKNNFGRSQAIFNFDLSLQKQFSKQGAKVFLEYQQRLQVPFIPSYVPILPYNMLMLGCVFPLHK